MEVAVAFKIHAIKLIHFSVRDMPIQKELGDILVNFDLYPAYNVKENLLKLSFRAWFHHKDKGDELANIIVDNIFSVMNLETFITDNKPLFFPEVWASMVGLSITHTRSLFAKELAGTAYQHILIPIIMPMDVVARFFPESIELHNKQVEKMKGSVKKAKSKPINPNPSPIS